MAEKKSKKKSNSLLDKLKNQEELTDEERLEAVALLEGLKDTPGKSGGSKPFKPFSQFPTPSLLAKAQRDYAAQGVVPEIDSETKLPEPHPPKKTKREVFNPEEYQTIDMHATNVPPEISKGTLKGLVAYLTDECETELQKVRSFFVWIASQNDEEHKIIYDPKHDCAINKAMMARANCYSYNKLLENMCSIAGVHCTIVEGGAKGFENEDDEEFSLDTHHWCMVYVAGAWRFIDQCFGSEYVIQDLVDLEGGGGSDSDIVVAGGGGNTPKTTPKMHYVGEEHFLTDPELFIYKHFPTEPQLQLLARPVTHDEFNKMAIINSSYFDFGVEDLSDAKARLETHNGEVRLWFKMNPESDVIMNYALVKNYLGPDEKPGNLNELVRLQNKDVRKDVWVHFTQVGTYKLQILVRPVDSLQMRELVKYRVTCKSPYYPKVINPVLPPGLQEIGPGADWRKLGIKTDAQNGVLKAKDGKAELTLYCNTEIAFSFHLKEGDTSENIPRCVLVESRPDGYKAYLRMPGHGTYLLKAFTGKRNDKSLSHTCNFLVECDQRCVEPSFPELFLTVGNVNECQLLKPIKGGAFMVLAGKLDDFVIELQITQDEVSFLVKLALWDGTQEKDQSEFACFEQKGKTLRILCRFKHAGDYLLRIFTKTDKEEKAFNLSYRYLLEVENPTYEYQAYPEKLKDWRPDLKLKSPKYKYLGQKTDYTFEVDVPEAKRVKVMKIGEQKTTALKKAGITFSGKVNTLLEQAQMVLYAEGDDDQVQQFWKFDVINSDMIGAQEVEYNLHEDEALQAKEMLDQEYKEVKEEADQRKAAETKAEMERKAEFDKNKAEYEKREADLERQAKERRLQTKFRALKINQDTVRDMLSYLGKDLNAHHVVIALLLFFRYTEDQSADSEDCKKILNGMGLGKVVEKMMNFDPNCVHPEIMARAKQVLRQCNWLALRDDNPCAGQVFDWIKECMDAYRGDVSVTAASRERQEKLLA